MTQKFLEDDPSESSRDKPR